MVDSLQLVPKLTRAAGRMKNTSLDRQCFIRVCMSWRQTRQDNWQKARVLWLHWAPVFSRYISKSSLFSPEAPGRGKHRKWSDWVTMFCKWVWFSASRLLLISPFQAALLAAERREGTESWQQWAHCGARVGGHEVSSGTTLWPAFHKFRQIT